MHDQRAAEAADRPPAVGVEDPPAVRLRLFAGARQAAGTEGAELRGSTVDSVLAEASRRFGSAFSAVLATSRVWVNGQPAGGATALADGDEVAVLPPVSGGSGR